MCEYCENDGYYKRNKSLISKTLKNNVDIDLAINVKDKKLVASIENLTMNIEEDRWLLPTKSIKFCPMCRKEAEGKIMGTNYYGRLKKPKRKTYLDYEKFHIGKSSCGWKFCFQTNKHFKSFEEFKKWLNDDNFIIFDEYGRKVDKNEFLKMILDKQNEDETQTRYDNEYTRNIDGFDFTDNDFS